MEKTASSTKFDEVNAGFMAESMRVQAIVQAQADTTSQPAHDTRQEVVKVREQITGVDSGKLD